MYKRHWRDLFRSDNWTQDILAFDTKLLSSLVLGFVDRIKKVYLIVFPWPFPIFLCFTHDFHSWFALLLV